MSTSSSLPASGTQAPAHSSRSEDLDWLRGLMLVLMTITHLPTVFGEYVGQPFGFVSAAEGFVFLSAYLVGAVYARMAATRGLAAMQHALWSRALKVYAVHIALFVFLVWVMLPAAETRDAQAITHLASFYLKEPEIAFRAGLLLLYNPPLLDILPMYVLFLLASPWLIGHAMRHGWRLLFGLSIVLWLFAQFDGGRIVHEAVASAVGLKVPYQHTGAFALLAWQLLWLAGLRAGATGIAPHDSGAAKHPARSRALLCTAVVLASVLAVWRHLVGHAPFGGDAALNALFDKWNLGPLRLLNFALLAILVAHSRDRVKGWARNSSVATLGRASLPVFSAHLVLCMVLLMSVSEAGPAKPLLLDAALLAASFYLLYGIARFSLGRVGDLGGAPQTSAAGKA